MEANYGEIRLFAMDFDGVLTDNYVYSDDGGREFVRCTRADGLGLQKLRKRGIEIIVLSTEKNPVVSQRCKKLEVRCFQGLGDKAVFLREYSKERGIDLRNVAFVGNDENDLGAMSIVGFPMAVGDACPSIRKAALYVSKRLGGCGAVREICDLIDSKME